MFRRANRAPGRRFHGLWLLLWLLVASPRPVLADGIAVDAESSASDSTSVTTLSWTHTVGSGSDRLLMVGVSSSVAAHTVTSLTYGAASLTFLGRRQSASVDTELWYLVAPAVGADTITVTLSAAARIVGGAVSFTGVHQTTPLGSYTSDTATSASPSVTVSSAEGEAVIDCLAAQGNAGSATVGSGQTQRWNINTGTGSSFVIGAGSTEPGASSVTMSWTLESSKEWALGAVAIKPAVVTLARLAEGGAVRQGRGTLIRWRTSYERDNLGFHVYRQVGSGVARITSALIPGSSFLARGSIALRTGRSYSWRDDQPGEAYWLEEVAWDGSRCRHGPFVAAEGGGAGAGHGQGPSPLAASTRAVGPEPARRAASPAWSDVRAAAHRRLLAAPAIKFLIRDEGVYRISAAALRNAGLRLPADPRRLRLSAEGREIPIAVSTRVKGRFDGHDYIEFYGVGLDTPATDTRAYWLSLGSPGGRVSRVRAPGSSTPLTYSRHTVEFRERSLLVLPIHNGDRENFFGPVLFEGPVEIPLALDQVAAGAVPPAVLEVAVQGASESSPVPTVHRIEVRVNGNLAGEVRLENREYREVALPLPHSLLREGANLVTLTAVGGPGDISLLDRLRLTYDRRLVAAGDRLRFRAPAGATVAVGGFSRRGIRLLDVTDPDRAVEILGTPLDEDGGYGLRAALPTRPGGERILFAFARADDLTAGSIRARTPSLLGIRRAPVDLVIVAPAELLPAVEPLAAMRRRQGHRVAAVAVEDVYDAFGFGEKDPAAIRRCLAWFRAASRPAPRFALLVGNGTYDPRDYLDLGEPDHIPIRLVASSLLETASDDWYADLDDRDRPVMAIGRLPARTRAEVERMVARLVARAAPDPAAATRSLVLVSDDDPSAGFGVTLTRLRALAPAGRPVTEIRRGTVPDATARAGLLQALADGPWLVHYHGHGNEDSWAGGLLTAADAGIASGRASVITAMTCGNGLFFDPRRPCLAGALLSGQGGAAAVWASSGLTTAHAQESLALAFFREIGGGARTLGEAILHAKRQVADLDVRRTWILFGDPSMPVH